MAYRVTMHNGRQGRNGAFNPKHNDRNFDLEEVDNIDQTKSHRNIYWNWTKNGFYFDADKASTVTFTEAEQKYYQKAFKRQWVDINYRYQQQRHPEKQKSFEEWSKLPQNLPEETVLQIGNTKAHPTEKQLYDASKLFLNKMQTWSKQHGNCIQILDLGFHFDEKVPHLQVRKVFQYRNSDGVLCIGQDKALEQAGIPLPDPSKKKGRYNNRKMTFDKMLRDAWVDSCRQVGLEIIDQPLVDVPHNMTKQQLLDRLLAEADEKAKQASETLTEASKLLEACKKQHEQLSFMSESYSDSFNSKLTEKKLVELDGKLSRAYDIANQGGNPDKGYSL